MPIVRLSGKVAGRRDPNRKTRARLLYRLFDAGWDIYNGNGDQEISLNNIQEKIVESDSFVFTPGATLEDIFKAASIFVGYQTNDIDLQGKTVSILNSDYSWDEFIDLIVHLNKCGTIKQSPEEFLDVVYKPKEVIMALEDSYNRRMNIGLVEPEGGVDHSNDEVNHHTGNLTKPDYSICVFCSASINRQDYLDEGRELGKMLAERNYGCISGAGKTGIMGEVVAGSVENGGWAAGSNVPHIIALEGLPDGLSEFWPRPDIYTRMEIMIEESHAFVIMPGGMGTVQEMLALVALKEQDHPLMKDKPIVVYNKFDDSLEERFWSKFIRLLNGLGGYDHYKVANDFQDIISFVEKQ